MNGFTNVLDPRYNTSLKTDEFFDLTNPKTNLTAGLNTPIQNNPMSLTNPLDASKNKPTVPKLEPEVTPFDQRIQALNTMPDNATSQSSFGLSGGIGSFNAPEPQQFLTPGQGTAQRIDTFADTLAPQVEAMQQPLPQMQQQNLGMQVKPQVMGKVYDGPEYVRGTMGEVVGPEIMDYYSAPLPAPTMQSMGTSTIGASSIAPMPSQAVGSDYEPLPPVQSDFIGGDVLPPVQAPLSGEGYLGDLGQRRQAYFSEELARNPRLMQDLYTRAYREVGTNPLNQQKWIETAANRAMFSGRSLNSVINDTRYFPSVSFRPIGSAPQDFGGVVSNVFTRGSNLTNLATDNASLDVARRRQQAGVTGQWLGAPGTTKEFFYRSDAGPYKTRAGLEAAKYAQQLQSAAPVSVGEQPMAQESFSATLPQVQVQQPGSMQVAQPQMAQGQPQMVQGGGQPSRQTMESSGFLNTIGDIAGGVASGVAQGTQNAPQSPMAAALQGGASFIETLTNQEARESTPLGKLFAKDQTGQSPMGGFANTISSLFGGDSAADNPIVNLGSSSPNASPKNYNNAFANKLVYSDASGPTGDQKDDSQPLFERLFGAI